MAEAEVYYCPVCGGPAQADALQCDFCAVHLATQRCEHCLKANFYSARHCSGCGRGLSAALSSRSELACPGCQVALQVLEHPKGVVFECLQCAGQFLEHALLRNLIENSERLAMVLPSRFRARNPAQQRIVYRNCPHCRALMHRKNFGQSSGVIVDVCAVHGIWFDAGELPAVLAFAESGGLERARRELREREARSSAPRAPAAAFQLIERTEAKRADTAIGEVAYGLLDFLVWILRR